MAPKIGYLLPTRENVMEGRPEAAPLLELAARAEGLGYDSIWVGDSLLARPRHEPLTLLAGVAGRVPRVELGTAVLLPALRNPVLLAHQVATLDQISEGRLILGVGFASDRPNIQAEFAAAGVPWDKRVGRMMEGLRLCQAFWAGQPVDWDGRWQVRGGVLAPTPYRPGGPPLWIGGNLQASLERAGRHFDGWFPNAANHAVYAEHWRQIKVIAAATGRNPERMTGAAYLTVSLDEDATRAEQRLDAFLEGYYGVPATVTRRRQVCYAGAAPGLAAWMAGYADAGATHLVVRFAGEHRQSLPVLETLRRSLGW
jgi:alkanesulfonate monooxygenase SsuD/methylene tetrahydromethanopterin reductase-like flavin-dependent oxidoreductase (luciferase family)